MKYEIAGDLQERMGEIGRRLELSHIDCERVVCVRIGDVPTSVTLRYN
jgi:predicted metallopeptidase